MTGKAGLLSKTLHATILPDPLHTLDAARFSLQERLVASRRTIARRKLLIEHHGPDRRSAKKVPRAEILGYALATACLIWVLHDFHIMQALRELARVDWKWVAVGMGSTY